MIECETTDRHANALTYNAIPEPISRSKIVKPGTFTAKFAMRGVWHSRLVILKHCPRNKLSVPQADWCKS